MEEELKLDQAVPTLTFEPFTETKKESPKPEPIYEEEALLSEQEKKQVEAFAEKIDLNNSTLVLQYGAGAQKKIADFSDKTLENVRSKDLGETGTMLASLVSELKQTGEQEEEKGFFASFFKKSTGKLEALKARYEKAEGKVDEIVDILTKHQVQLIQDAAMLDQMYQLNQTYFKELSMYILANTCTSVRCRCKKRFFSVKHVRSKILQTGTMLASFLKEKKRGRKRLFLQVFSREFHAQKDLNNSTLVHQYAAMLADVKKTRSQIFLTKQNVRSKDLGETGTMLASLVSELKQTGEPEEEKGFFASFFKKSTGKLEALKARYEKAEGKVDEIVDILTKHQVQLIQDAAMLDQMYQLNQTYFKELSMYILAGKKKVDKARQTELETLRQKAIASGTQEDAQAVSDYSSMIERFEKKVHDLELTRMVALQMAPQIRMVQSNDTVMAEKIQSTIVNTIPLWKNQMVIAMGENHSAQAAKAQKEVTDMTNQLLLSNAQKLKQTTVDIRRESERGIVDIETLRQTNGILIDTMNEILKIQQEGRKQRRQAQAQLAQMEQQMKEKLLEISK